jgi:tRNA threonylcarbamoyladenosine biosynthesis protein TsaB
MQALHLAIDTSTSMPSAALFANDRVLADWLGPDALRHHETLLKGIDHCLRGYDLKDLNFISVGVGPGMFTGLRIGITTAKFLADPLKIPCVEVSSLLALGKQIPESLQSKSVWAVADAKAKRVYATRIDQNSPDFSPADEENMAMPPEEFALKLQDGDFLIGEGAWLYRALWSKGVTIAEEKENTLKGSSIGYLGWKRYSLGLTVSANAIQPKYLKSGNSVV